MAIYSSIGIQSSVGKNGKNNPVDVKTVQTRLNELMRSPRKKLTEDGKIGSKTIGMIRDFQETVLNFRRPDSLVDPNGKSHRALNDPASESKWARKSSETKLDAPTLSATQKGTSSKEFTIWFVSDHYDGVKVGASIKNMTQSQIVSVLFRNGTLPKDVYVTLAPPHIWSIAFGGSYFDITKGWGKSYNPGLVLVKEKYSLWIKSKRHLFETKGYLNRETERKADIYSKKMSAKFRRLVAQEITATGYSVGELSNMGVGAYETAYFVVSGG